MSYNSRSIPTIDVEMMAVGLPMGHTKRGMCPVCNGGSTHEKTFTVTRAPEGLLFNCHRANCPTGGIITGSSVYLSDLQGIVQIPKDNSYYGEYRSLEQPDREYFVDRFDLADISNFAIGVNGRGQYVMRILDPNGMPRGYVVRQKPWSGKPLAPRVIYGTYDNKSRVYPESSETILQSIYHPRFSDGIMSRKFVLVEDQISAMKAAQAGLTGVALLGVSMDFNKIHELQKMRPTEVLFALDKDATRRSFWLARNFGLAFMSVRVMLLEKDLKDIEADDVLPILGFKS